MRRDCYFAFKTIYFDTKQTEGRTFSKVCSPYIILLCFLLLLKFKQYIFCTVCEWRTMHLIYNKAQFNTTLRRNLKKKQQEKKRKTKHKQQTTNKQYKKKRKKSENSTIIRRVDKLADTFLHHKIELWTTGLHIMHFIVHTIYDIF